MAAVAINFNGPINHPATTKLRNMICSGANERMVDAQGKPTSAPRYDVLYLLMNSSGGGLDDGLALFSFLRTLPLNLVTVNMGFIASIAIAPFLAGKHRIACPNSVFHFHNYEWNFPAAHTSTRAQLADHSQFLDAAKIKTFELLKENTLLTDADFETLKLIDYPVIKEAPFAHEKGIIQEIGFPNLPAGTPFYNVDY